MQSTLDFFKLLVTGSKKNTANWIAKPIVGGWLKNTTNWIAKPGFVPIHSFWKNQVRDW